MPDLPSMLRDLVEGAVTPLDVDGIVARRRIRRQRRRVAVAAAVMVVVVGASVASLALRSSRSRQEQVRVAEVPRQQTVSLESSLAQLLLVSPGGGTGALSGPLDHVEVTDPATGKARRAALPLPSAQSSLFPYLVRGRSLVVVLDSQTGPYTAAIGTAYAVPSTFDREVKLGPASSAFVSLDPNRVWLTSDNATPDQRLHGIEYGTRRMVQEVDLDGRATSPQYALTDRRSAIAAVRGGLLTERPDASPSAAPVLEVWDPATDRVVHRFAAGASVVAASGAFVVWRLGECGLQGCALHVSDLQSGAERVLVQPHGLVWDGDFSTAGTAFSPDGAHLALVARRALTPEEASRFGLTVLPGTRPAAVDVVDLATGARTERRFDAWNGSLAPAWSPDGNALFVARDAGHVAYFVAADPASASHEVAVADAGEFLVVERPPVPAGASSQQWYEVDATVLENAQHGPELCTGVEQSLPPLCSGPPVIGWDWSQAPEPQRAMGTTYGTYHLVGNYDGAVFTLTEAPSAYHASAAPLPDFTTPCSPPAGGWRITDASKVRSLDDYKALQSAARSSPDYAGMWTDQKTPTKSTVAGFGIVNVAFTGNLDAHRSLLAALWGGPICVLQHPRAYSELERVRDALSGAEGEKLGLQVIEATPNDVADRVDVQVMLATPTTQTAVDDAFGPSVVHVESILRPVP